MGVQFSDEFKKILERVDFFDFRPPHDWTGQEKLDNYYFERKKNLYPCWHIRNNIVIFWNGDVTPCCADFHGRGVFGNIQNYSICDLWKGERLTIFRQQGSGKKNEIELCKGCSIL
jgi:radical SAM protein with 4Fe4S-binding SPASM domain